MQTYGMHTRNNYTRHANPFGQQRTTALVIFHSPTCSGLENLATTLPVSPAAQRAGSSAPAPAPAPAPPVPPPLSPAPWWPADLRPVGCAISQQRGKAYDTTRTYTCVFYVLALSWGLFRALSIDRGLDWIGLRGEASEQAKRKFLRFWLDLTTFEQSSDVHIPIFIVSREPGSGSQKKRGAGGITSPGDFTRAHKKQSPKPHLIPRRGHRCGRPHCPSHRPRRRCLSRPCRRLSGRCPRKGCRRGCRWGRPRTPWTPPLPRRRPPGGAQGSRRSGGAAPIPGGGCPTAVMCIHMDSDG